MSPELNAWIATTAALLVSLVTQEWFPYTAAGIAGAWVLRGAKGWTPRDIGLAILAGAGAFVAARVLQVLLAR